MNYHFNVHFRVNQQRHLVIISSRFHFIQLLIKILHKVQSILQSLMYKLLHNLKLILGQLRLAIQYSPNSDHSGPTARYTYHFDNAPVGHPPELFPSGCGNYSPLGNTPVSVAMKVDYFNPLLHSIQEATLQLGNIPPTLPCFKRLQFPQRIKNNQL